MPFADEDVRIDLMCGRGEGTIGISVRADALWPLGLHPEQPTARPTGPSPPAWWHAAAEQRGW